MGFGSCLLPPPASNPLLDRLSGEAARLAEHGRQLQARIDDLLASVQAIRSTEGKALTERLDLVRKQIEELVERTRILRADRDADGGTRARAELDAAKQERAALAEQLRCIDADKQAELGQLRRERDEVSAQIRAIYAARRTKTPLTGGVTYGDLVRIEPQWHADALAMATIRADMLWAADLDALPPVIWASEAAPDQVPVVFDSHELFCDLEYMPDIYRAAWRLIGNRFIPRAAVTIAVCEPQARILAEEHGARQTLVIPNYAVAGQTPALRLRQKLNLADDVALAVHIGNIQQTRNPHQVVDLIAELARLHVAFVGTPGTGMVDELRSRAVSHGVADRLHFVEPVPVEQLTGFVSDADVSLIMMDGSNGRSRRYTIPNKLYDSLAAGIPVAASSNILAGEFVEREGLGRTFELGNAKHLAATIGELLADSTMRERVRSRAGEFVWPQAEPALFALVDELLAGARDGGGDAASAPATPTSTDAG